MKKLIVICLITGLFLPLIALGELEQSQNLEEAKGFGLTILKKLPEAVKRVWQEKVLPLWQKMWEWLKTQLQRVWNWFKLQLKKIWNWIIELLDEGVEKLKFK